MYPDHMEIQSETSNRTPMQSPRKLLSVWTTSDALLLTMDLNPLRVQEWLNQQYHTLAQNRDVDDELEPQDMDVEILPNGSKTSTKLC